MKKIAITGGVACGKSSVCRLMKERGATVVSADDIVHQLLSPQTDIGQQAIDLLGPDIVVANRIDRQIVAKKVFSQPELLSQLEALLHPAVRQVILADIERAKKTGAACFVAEVPLLFEAGMETLFDLVITVTARPDLCKLRSRQGIDYGARTRRMITNEERIRRADIIIENNGSQEELTTTVNNIMDQQLQGDN